MIFQPAVIALLFAAVVSALLLLATAPYAWGIVRDWDVRSGSERQIVFERRTYLLSASASFVLVTQALALLLFVFTADRMAAQIVGAMCAVGTLSANGFGFPALLCQIVVFFAAACWLVINHADTRSPAYPLVRTKYVLLLALCPLVLISAALQYRFFAGIKADVITSCCGSLFSEESEVLSGSLAAWPPLPTMIAFYAAQALVIGATVYRRRHDGAANYAVAAASALAFVLAMAGVVSFLSPYIYEHPNHHCPFCVLKPEYGYRGYWLYLPLFAATGAGLGAGALQPFARRAGLGTVIPRMSRTLATWSGGLFLLFSVIATCLIINSRLLLIAL